MIIEDGADRVVIVNLGRCIAIGQESMLTVHQTSEGGIVATRLGEVEISQLEHGLHILDRRAAIDALASATH